MKKKTLIIIGGILGLIWVLVFFYLVDKSENKVKKHEEQEYPWLDKDMGVRGVVIEAKLSKRPERGIYIISLNDGVKFSAYKDTRNYDYDRGEYDFYYCLNIGDSIFKDKDSDSIFIFKKDKSYYYIYGKTINDSPHPSEYTIPK